jgi:hypothetical protein
LGNHHVWYLQYGEVFEMMTAKDWRRRLLKLGYPETPRAERLAPAGFTAWRRGNGTLKLANLKNISSTGILLLTEERWPIGELIPLTLQGEGSPENRSQLQLEVQARVVQHGEDGIGLTFVLPACLDLNLWKILIKNVSVITDEKSVLFMLRMLRTILFLYRLCDAAANESIRLLGGELDEFRTENAMDIALGTEKLLASEPDADKMRAHPKLVTNILRNGSWAYDDLTKKLWAGLLASSCDMKGADESNNAYVELLIHITPTQSQIYLAACKKALELAPQNEDSPSTQIIFTPEEMIQVTDIYDLSRLATDIAYLFHAGLVEKCFNFSSYLPMESFDATPSRIGIALYKQCKGHCIELPTPLVESEDVGESEYAGESENVGESVYLRELEDLIKSAENSDESEDMGKAEDVGESKDT